MTTVDRLLETSGLTIEQAALRASLPYERMLAIAEGRWTPSPEERERVAAVFHVAVAEISWGHSVSPRVQRYFGTGLTRDFRQPSATNATPTSRPPSQGPAQNPQ